MGSHTHDRLRFVSPASALRLLARLLIMACTILSTAALAEGDTSEANYWRDHQRGWHFYEPAPAPIPPAKEPEAPKVAPPAPAAVPPEIAAMERLKQRLEQLRGIAVMNPSEPNVRRYMELEAAVVRRAALFSDVAQRIGWATPELDLTLEGRPVNAQALEVYDRELLAQRSSVVSTLGRDHALFFFYRGDCPFCHAFAPTLEAFARRHGVPVVPISLDGGGLPEFPQFRRDNGAAQTLHVTQVPAVYLVQPYSGEIRPIGFGVLSESQLLERIATFANVRVSRPATTLLQSARLE